MSLVVYGATGLTGRLVVEAAQARGLAPVLMGRNAQKLQALAAQRDLPWCAVELGDAPGLERSLEGARAVINAAGPFARTTEPVLRACLRKGVHYLDVSGELDAIAHAARFDRPARELGLALMPAVGFDVIASDCLGLHLLRRAARPLRLRVALAKLGTPSAGSQATLLLEGRRPLRVRRDGALRELLPGSLSRRFPFAAGLRMAVGISWGDLVTAPYTLGVRDVETYVELTPEVRVAISFQRAFQRALRPGSYWGTAAALPGAEAAHAGPPEVVAELEDARGARHVARLHTGEVYKLSADLSVEVAARVLGGDVQPGFQTAARVYGADLILGFAGVSRVDLS